MSVTAGERLIADLAGFETQGVGHNPHLRSPTDQGWRKMIKAETGQKERRGYPTHPKVQIALNTRK